MSRSPFLTPTGRERAHARRVRRRRRLALAAALLALAAAATAVVTLRGSGAAPPRAAPSGRVQAHERLANGPVAETPGPLPLAVKLATAHDPVHVRFARPPRSGLLFDLDTGRVLWRRDPERVLPIASLTKMMTALVVVAHGRPRTPVLITKEALAYQGSGVGVLPRGKHVRLETLLNGLLLPSGNDAAIALAQRVAGSVPRFVALMNARAAAMELRCTHYTSPSGFVDAGNHSCAVDLAAEARAVLDQPRLARIVRRRQAVLPFPIKGGHLFLYNNNPLLLAPYPGAIGIKTGFTAAAGACLVGAAQRNGHRLGVVLLHSPDWLDQARTLLDRGFAVER